MNYCTYWFMFFLTKLPLQLTKEFVSSGQLLTDLTSVFFFFSFKPVTSLEDVDLQQMLLAS